MITYIQKRFKKFSFLLCGFYTDFKFLLQIIPDFTASTPKKGLNVKVFLKFIFKIKIYVNK